MTETLFRFDKENMHACQMSYRGVKNQEYYLGDYTIDVEDCIDVRAEKRAIGMMSVIHNTANTRQFFRRSRAHIRKDATDVTVFWFVNHGSVFVSHPSGEATVSKGDMLITKSLTPSSMDCRPDKDTIYDVYQIVVPSHALEGVLADDALCGLKVESGDRELALIQQLLGYLFDVAQEEDEMTGQKLLDAILSLLGRAVQDCNIPRSIKPSLTEVRVNEIVRFINTHLSDPNLSIDMVAEGCGISPRYTFHLLKSCGTSFSAFVWERRLKMASQLMCSFDKAEMLVSEVAYRVGFKSAAHFSRLFKQTYNFSPTEYRRRYVVEAGRSPLN